MVAYSIFSTLITLGRLGLRNPCNVSSILCFIEDADRAVSGNRGQIPILAPTRCLLVTSINNLSNGISYTTIEHVLRKLET